jgi:hypothetical protein
MQHLLTISTFGSPLLVASIYFFLITLFLSLPASAHGFSWTYLVQACVGFATMGAAALKARGIALRLVLLFFSLSGPFSMWWSLRDQAASILFYDWCESLCMSTHILAAIYVTDASILAQHSPPHFSFISTSWSASRYKKMRQKSRSLPVEYEAHVV